MGGFVVTDRMLEMFKRKIVNTGTLYNKIDNMPHFTYGIPILEIAYVIASVLFILGLKMLSHPLQHEEAIYSPHLVWF